MPNSSASSESALADLVSLWQRRRAAGQLATPAELCRDRPELLPQLVRRLAALEQMAGFENAMHETDTLDTSCAPQTATSPAGRPEIPGYEIVDELGRGGMGVVYRVLDRKRGRQVALKTIQGITADSLYRFKQEFRLRGDLHHPNLVSLFELIAEGGHWFFTMELVEGSSFVCYVRGGPDAFGSPAAVPLAAPEQFQRLRHSLRQLAEGIEALHMAGRLHRDLKPSNVMVTRTGRVVLLDFGLIAQLNPQPLHESTTQHLLGTIAYMSPEQARSESLSPASDWYSVGVMLYEALTGRLPFTGHAFRILSDKQHLDPPPPRSLAPGIPEDLNALCVALLSRDPTARPSGRDRLRLIQGGSSDSTPTLEMHAPEAALVGRGEQLAALADAYAASRNRRTVALFLSGPSGVGKSSLLQQFLKQLRLEGGAVILTGQCYEQESVPYKAFDGVIDALSRFLRRLSPLEVQALLPRDTASLLRVFPMLRGVEASLAISQGRETPDPQEVRQRAFAALRELIARLADRKPVVICIDDLQWGDTDSAALLTELVRPPEAPCFLFVGCHRSEESTSPLLNALAESNSLVWSEVDRRHLNLDPLSSEEATELAIQLLRGTEFGHACAAVIARESGGSPFFIHELVRYLYAKTERSLAEGLIDLGDVLWDRIEQLPPASRELLAVVAVAARPLPQDVACRAVGLEQGRIEELTLLRSHRLARGTGMSGEDLLVTYHDRVRDAFHVHLSAEDTRNLHRRLAEALEVWGRADVEWLATHWEYSGETRRAGEYYGQAADRAAETLAFDNAADLYRRALRMGSDDMGLLRQFQRKLGDALANAGRGAEAAKAYQVLVADASGMEAIELQRKVTEQFLISGHVDEGLVAAQAVLKGVGMSFPRTPARAVLGFLLMRARLWIRGARFRERSVEEVPATDLCQVDVSWTLGTGLALIDPMRGAYFQARNLLLALRVGEPYRVARALAQEAAYNAIAGSYSRNRTTRLIKIGRDLANRIGNPHAQGMILLCAGITDYLSGHWRNALDQCTRAEVFFRSHCRSVYWELNTAQAFQIWSLIYLGEIAEMNRLCPKLMKEAHARGDLHGLVNLLFFAVPILSMAADRAEQGYQELSEELYRWTRQGTHVPQVNAIATSIYLLLYLGKEKAGQQTASELSKTMEQSQLYRVQHMRMSTCEVTARVQLATAKEAKNPATYLKLAVRNAVRLQSEKRQDGRALATLIRAQVANIQGDLDTAKTLLEQAMSGFVACEMGLFAAASRRRLGQLLGGEKGRSLMADADTWMTARGVRNPARMAAVYAPGFSDP
jgi:hypothetical protein